MFSYMGFFGSCLLCYLVLCFHFNSCKLYFYIVVLIALFGAYEFASILSCLLDCSNYFNNVCYALSAALSFNSSIIRSITGLPLLYLLKYYTLHTRSKLDLNINKKTKISLNFFFSSFFSFCFFLISLLSLHLFFLPKHMLSSLLRTITPSFFIYYLSLNI